MHAATLQGDGDVGIRGITFAEDGAYFAVSCWDRTLRIWNSSTQLEIARLAHNAAVIGVVWLEGAAGVMVLGEDGVLGKWTRSGDQNQWQWARIMHVGTEQAAVLAYARDRIAVAFPGWGVRVWMWSKGTWIAQRSVMRMEVTALRFVEGGDGLLGGTKDGVVWYCAVPGGTLRAYAFLQTSITSIDVNPSTGAYALVAGSGSASMVRLGVEDNKRVKHTYTNKQKQATAEFGGVYCPGGKTIMYGTVDGCVLVWDVKGQGVVYGMEHDADDEIHAVASCDGGTEGYVVTGSRGGRLAWWPQPTGQDAATHAPRKRTKVK
ncbi:WD40-repeat-containing domain protein [Mycena rebaudengoi]|nr:WD40-repeat-containing domain protein [Mycena rebaudengoi]